MRLFPSLPVLDNLLIGAHDYPGESLVTLHVPAAASSAPHAKAARDKAHDHPGSHGLAHVADTSVAICPTASRSWSASRAP